MTKTRAALAGLGGLIVVALGAAWWLGLFSDAPEEVSIDAAAEAVSGGEAADDTAAEGGAADDTAADDTAAEGGAADDTAADDTAADDTAAVGGAADDTAADDTAADDTAAEGGADLTGTWTVQPNEDATFVGYRIDEVLTTVGDFEVVGRTSDVSGTVEADGTTITDVSIVAQMGTLTTDSAARDGQMRSQALETDQFPEATFSLTSPIELAAVPVEAETISVTAVGELTIHGVTQPVEFPLQARMVGGSIVVVGQLPVLLADYDIDPPRAPVVASVEGNATLELSLVLER